MYKFFLFTLFLLSSPYQLFASEPKAPGSLSMNKLTEKFSNCIPKQVKYAWDCGCMEDIALKRIKDHPNQSPCEYTTQFVCDCGMDFVPDNRQDAAMSCCAYSFIGCLAFGEPVENCSAISCASCSGCACLALWRIYEKFKKTKKQHLENIKNN